MRRLLGRFADGRSTGGQTSRDPAPLAVRGVRARPRRPRRRRVLGLGLLGVVLTIAGLAPELGFPPRIWIFAPTEGMSRDDLHRVDEVKKLGGRVHFAGRTSPFLRFFGGRDALYFSFAGRAFDDEALARFVKDHGDSVVGLDLLNTGLTDAGLRHLAGLPHLNRLALGNGRLGSPGLSPWNGLTDAGLIHLKGLSGLRSLDLGGLPITDAGLDAIRDLPHLGELNLDRTQVLGPGLGRLRSLPQLVVMTLEEGAITDEGLAHIQGASHLQVLSLAGVPLTGLGLVPLRSLPRLDQLRVRGCGLRAVDLDIFRVACPSVKVE